MTKEERLAHQLEVLQALIAEAQSPYAENITAILHRAATTIESATRTSVQIDRQNGASWQTIAVSLAVTRQAAQQRYGA